MKRKMVDVHCHVVADESMIAPQILELMKKDSPWAEDWQLCTPEFLIEQMDRAGVQYAVLQAYDMKNFGLDIPNRFVADCLKNHPDRFICGYASVDPVMRGVDTAISWLQEGYDMGLRGLKIHPIGMRFAPDDKKLYPLYEKVTELKIPVGFHILPIVHPFTKLKDLEISRIDAIAKDFPEMKIQICHFGKYHIAPDVYDLMHCCLCNQNVYTDLSAPIPMNKEGIMGLFKWVKELNLIDKSMFGTDFPMVPPSWYVECIEKTDFSEEEKQKIMCDNALRFVGREDLSD
jgi:uncharacterized protein